MKEATRQLILDMVAAQRDLTLATLRADGYPQANTVSYANDGLRLYFGTGCDSQKARNIEYCNKVSIAIDTPYSTWDEIKALSMGGIAHLLPADSAESRLAMRLLAAKFPAVLDMSPPVDPSAVRFVKIVPQVISVLDYARGFGHTELVKVEPSEILA